VNTSLPPVSNRPLYVYRIVFKVISFIIFGLASLLLVFPIMPVFLLIFRPVENFRKTTRRFVSFFFRFFISFMTFTGVVELKTADRDFFKNLKSKIVVANHPSLLDVVMIISLIPNADVIVQGDYRNTVIGGVIRLLYILNTLNFEEMAAACKESLAKGNCLVIFPEGTRTRRDGEMRLKKGAARISLLTGTEIVAAHIGGTDKYGLGKKEPFLSFNHTDKYIYIITLQKIINPKEFEGLEMHRAVRRLNERLLDIFKNPVNKQ